MREKRLKKGIALILCFFLGISGLPVNADETKPIEKKVSESNTNIQELDSEQELSALISDTWDKDYFGTIVLDPEEKEVEIDGKSEKIPASGNQKKESPEKSEEVLEEYLDTLSEDNLYHVEETEDGEYEITAPFQTKRLIVEEDILDHTYGAQKVYYNTELGETILQFETEQETKAAFENLCAEYGEEKCYPDQVYYVDDILKETAQISSGSYSWGNAYMGMNTLKEKAAGKYAPVTVAILDTGIDKSNFLFQSRTISSKSYNFIDDNKNVTDNFGHGTHVAGIIADATPANVQFLILKISNTSGYSSLLTIKTALQYALNQNVDVVNMSLGFMAVNAMSCTYLDSLINKAYKNGIAICAAAGNSGVNVSFCYPACNSKTIAVSAIGPNENMASYSNYGSLIDFCAPGSQIISAAAGGTLVAMSGTSMSTPHIAAAIAYMKMIQPNLSVQGVYNELKVHCKDLGEKGKDSSFGWGCPILTNLLDTGIINKNNIVSNSVATPKMKNVKNVKKGIQISWKKVGNADKYYLYRKLGSGSFKKIKTISGKTTKYLDKNVKQGKKYTYAVKAVKNKKTSGYSNSKQLIRLKKLTTVRVKRQKGRKITISWSKLARVSGYQICYAGTKKMKNAKTIFVSAQNNKQTIKGLKKKVYYFKVRSLRKVGDVTYVSQWSTVKKLKI